MNSQDDIATKRAKLGFQEVKKAYPLDAQCTDTYTVNIQYMWYFKISQGGFKGKIIKRFIGEDDSEKNIERH